MRKKRMATRKRSALGWLAALCLLVLFCLWTGLYGLTPQSALRRQGQYFFVGDLTLVDSVRDGYETDFGAGGSWRRRTTAIFCWAWPVDALAGLAGGLCLAGGADRQRRGRGGCVLLLGF